MHPEGTFDHILRRTQAIDDACQCARKLTRRQVVLMGTMTEMATGFEELGTFIPGASKWLDWTMQKAILEKTGKPVLTTPDTSVMKLKTMLG